MKNILRPEDLPAHLTGEENSDGVNYAGWLLCVVTILTVFGLTMLYSTSYNVAGVKYFQNQLMWVVIGTCGGVFAFVTGYRKLASWGGWLCVAVVVLLLIARLFFPAINGAHRWIRIPIPGMVLSVQPSEFAKLALALFVARYCADNLRTFSMFRWKAGLLPLAVGAGGVLACILLGKDFGTTVLAASMVFCIMLAAGLYLRYLFIPLIFLGVAAPYIYFFDPMRLARVTSFMRPEEVAKTSGYQLYNSLLALGSGNWFGIGFMESRMKARYLPEAHTDFILAIVGEELGLAALLALVLAYGVFCYLGMKIALSANSRLGMLLGFGLTLVITLQAVINVAVVSGSAPTKGMPAPFISYGGTNMVMCLVSVGILLSIAADTVNPGYSEEVMSSLKSRLPFGKR